MVIPERKQRKVALAKSIKERLGSYEVTQMLELLQLMKEEAKDDLLWCRSEELVTKQAEGRVYDKIISLITRASIETMQSSGSE